MKTSGDSVVVETSPRTAKCLHSEGCSPPRKGCSRSWSLSPTPWRRGRPPHPRPRHFAVRREDLQHCQGFPPCSLWSWLFHKPSFTSFIYVGPKLIISCKQFMLRPTTPLIPRGRNLLRITLTHFCLSVWLVSRNVFFFSVQWSPIPPCFIFLWTLLIFLILACFGVILKLLAVMLPDIFYNSMQV